MSLNLNASSLQLTCHKALYVGVFSLFSLMLASSGQTLAQTLQSETPISKTDLTGFEMAAPVSDNPLAAGKDDLNLEVISSHDLLTTGMQDVEDNRLDLAVRKFQEILRREPGNVSAHNNLAVCLKRQGNKEAAIEEFRKALANNPSRPELYNNLASSLIAVGRYDEALTALYQALRLQPDFAEAHRNLGHVLASKGDNDGAVTAYQQAIQESLTSGASGAQNDTRLSDLHFDLGDCLRSIHRYEQALLEYRAADKLGAAAGEAYRQSVALRTAKCYEALGRYEESRKLLNQLLEKDPDDTDSLNCLGVVLWKMKQLPEAVFVLERALKLDPSYPQARNNLGIVLYELKRYEEAVGVWKQALSLKRDYPEAHYNMGVALYQTGLFDQSIDAYKECLKYAPQDPFAHNNLGLAYLRKGERADAIAQWRRAIECDQNCAEAYTNLGKLLKESAVKPE